MVKFTKSSIKVKIILVLGVILLFLFYLFNITSSNNLKITPLNPPFAISSETQNKYALNDSHLEWLNNVKIYQKNILKQLTVTSIVKGQVVEVSREKGKLSGLKYYYTGEAGYYVYHGSVKLTSEEDTENTLYFSEKRMKVIKIYEYSSQGINERKFEDIKVGDIVEVEESVDLALPNINDENVLYLTIKILK